MRLPCLFCTGKKRDVYVEVKATRSNGKGIILTSGEVDFARRHQEQMALFVLHSIAVTENGNVTGGHRKILNPWDVEQGCLKPISFVYDVPD